VSVPSEALLRAAALASFNNAKNLCAEAELLEDNGHVARAAALAVIGAEEFGKAIVYLVAALLPSGRKWLPAKLDGHELKHRVCDSAEAAEATNEKLWIVHRQNGFPVGPQGRLTDMAVVLAGWGLRSLVDAKEARQHFTERRKHHEDERRRFGDKEDLFLALRQPDLKNAALYVDLDRERRVLQPDRVDARAARISIAGLKWYLEAYIALPSVLHENEAWESFAAEVRGRANGS
jgi:hypothetical protein